MIERLLEPRVQIPEEDKRFSNRYLKNLIIPILIEQFLVQLVGIADTLMVSYAGETAVSGVSLVNQLATVFMLVFTALASGGAVIASQYVGNGDKKRGILASSQLVMLMALIGTTAAAVLVIFGRTIINVLFGSAESAIIEAGMTYLRISAWSFPFLAVYNACAALFRSMGDTKTLMKVSIVMNIMNVAGNAIGIFVLHAGAAGVAYPSLFSRIFAAAVMVTLSLNKENTLYINVRKVFTWQGRMLRRILRIGIPGSVENGLFQISKVALGSMVSLFGTTQIAAYGVALSLWSMSALFCIGMGPAFITVIGQNMGAGNIDGADYYMKKLLRMTYLGAFVWCSAFTLSTPLVLKLYSLNDETLRLVMLLVVLHNTLNMVFGPMAFAFPEGLKAAGDAKYTMFAAIVATVICRVTFSALFGIVLGMGVIGITLAMIVDWIVKATLIFVRYRIGKWRSIKLI